MLRLNKLQFVVSLLTFAVLVCAIGPAARASRSSTGWRSQCARRRLGLPAGASDGNSSRMNLACQARSGGRDVSISFDWIKRPLVCVGRVNAWRAL
jgi:hypothetical protein